MMKVESRTKEPLIEELEGLRQRVAELEKREDEAKWTQEALKESLEKYRAVFNGARDGIVLVDSETGRIVDCNPEFENQTGRQLGQLNKMKIWELRPPEKIEAAKKTFLEIKRKEMGGSGELEFQKPDGEILAIEFVSRKIKIQGREYLHSIARNITERKQAEEALQRSQERLTSFMNSATDGFALFDSKFNFVDINKVTLAMAGLNREEIIGKNIFDIIPNLKETGRYDRYMEVMRTGKPLFMDDIVPHPRFGDIHLAVRAFKVDDGLGIITTDITEHRQADEALRQSERKYRSLVNNVKLGIFRSTPEATGGFLEVNPAMEEITGYSREELLQMNVSDLYVHPEERGTVLEEIASTKGKTASELDFRKKDGTEITISDTKVAVRDGEGRILFFDGILEDITKRKRAEDELRRSRKQLRDLATHLHSAREEERKRIALDVHDELGQELTALKMDLSWLAKRFSKGQELPLDRTKAMLKQVDTTIQTVRRISAQLRPALLDDFGLTAAIEWQVEEFQKLTGIRCELILNPREITIPDEDLSTAIFRILQEILTNVTRHAQATKVRVNLTERASKLILRVSDNGKGITKEALSHPKSFGLFGIRERVRFFGGTVKFLGAQDKGTVITVSIPLKKGKLNAKNPYR